MPMKKGENGVNSTPHQSHAAAETKDNPTKKKSSRVVVVQKQTTIMRKNGGRAQTLISSSLSNSESFGTTMVSTSVGRLIILLMVVVASLGLVTVMWKQNGERPVSSDDSYENFCIVDEDGTCNPSSSSSSSSSDAYHGRTLKEGCAVNPVDPVAWQPGDLNRMFERIVREHEDKVMIWSRPAIEKDGDEATSDEKKKSSDTDGPWIITIDEFLSPTEANRFIYWGHQKGFKQSMGFLDIDPGTGERRAYLSQERTSTNTFCGVGCVDDPVVQDVQQRMANLTGIPAENGELLQLLKYETGQFYSEHNDYIRRERDSMAGPRILTVLLYLSDVDSGGETKFSWMDINVSPKVGRLVIWPSVLDGNPLDIDDRTNHEAMPVSRGQKFAANAWFHLRSVVLAAERGC